MSLLIIVGIFYIFLFHTSFGFKNEVLRTVGSKSPYHSKSFITQKLYKLSSITNKEISYSEFYKKIWPTIFDPKNPDTWGKTRVYKIKYPLQGENIEILPRGAKGYLMDNTCNANTWRGDAYSFTMIGNDSVIYNDIVHASVYCYVSKEYNGTWVKLLSEGTTIGKRETEYDLKNKGTWQKLNIKVRCKNGKAPVYLYFAKYGVTDFSTLKGNVIFAYPQYNVKKSTPRNPDSGWATRIHKTIYPLVGKNVKIVPKGTKGYLMDRTCNASTWRNNAYSFTKIGNDSVMKDDTVLASVYCYVSKEYNGTWVKLLSEGTTIGKRETDYDLRNKGTWQKLNLKVGCKHGKAPVYLYFAKYGVTDFSTLKGHVIFAYPQYKVIIKDSLQSYFIPEKSKKQIKSKNILVKQNLTKIHFDSVQMNSNKPKLTDKSAQSLKIFFNSKYYQSGLFNFSVPNLLPTDTTQIDSDLIRNLVAKLVSEDTTYYPYYAKIVINSVSDNFITPRTVRWQFAWQIFTKEYNWKQKIFGNGFDYLNWYGFYFFKDKTKSDWPHNPFLTVLLYSGIIGLLLYLFFLYKIFYYYIKYIKEYYILFIFFLITFYFSFFSAVNPFNPPVTGFFVILPFFIHAVHKKDDGNNPEIKNT